MNAEPEHDMVDLASFPNPTTAQIVKSILEDAGIPVYVQGENLTDEWAASRQVMNIMSVTVQVPSDRLEEARRVVEEARAAGEDLDEPDAG